MLIGLLWLSAVTSIEFIPAPLLIVVALPGLELGAGATLVLGLVLVKWLLLGRVRPGTHGLWSCWCSRWDFLYVAWDVLASTLLMAVEGTLLLNGFLRVMGVRLGRHVVLGPGFTHVADPDLLNFE